MNIEKKTQEEAEVLGGFWVRSEDCDRLIEELHAARAEAEKARLTWHTAENELWIGDLRERIEKLTSQRDRAMKLIDGIWEEYAINSGFGTPLLIELEVEKLKAEIAKENEE